MVYHYNVHVVRSKLILIDRKTLQLSQLLCLISVKPNWTASLIVLIMVRSGVSTRSDALVSKPNTAGSIPARAAAILLNLFHPHVLSTTVKPALSIAYGGPA